MSTVLSRPIPVLLFAAFGILTLQAQAQTQTEKQTETQIQAWTAAPEERSGSPAPDTTSASKENDYGVIDAETRRDRRRWHRSGNAVVSIGHDSKLAAGESADAVVSIIGSSTSEGDVKDAVVSIMGNTHVTGPVGDAVVAVLGSVYVNSKIGGDAVAVMGNMELGPQAEVGGEVVVVGGVLKRDPAAVVHGAVSRVSGGFMPQFRGLQTWIKECLLYGRPLAFEPGLGWAWSLALGFLAFYVLLALMVRGAVDRCVETLETRTGHSIVAALLALVLTPVAYVVLCVTVIGIALIPFLWIGLFCAGLFGKTVMLAAIGKRLTRYFGPGPAAHTAFAVLIGGIITLALYVVPFVGFIVYKLLGILGLGVILYTLLLAIKAAKEQRAQGAGGQPAVQLTPAVSPGAPGASAGFAPMYADTAAAGTMSAGAPAASAAVGSAAAGTATAGTAGADDVRAASDTAKTAATGSAAIAFVDFPRAGFWLRMAALAIDVILIAVLVALIDVFDHNQFLLLLLAAYGAIMWKLRGTTIGGIVLDLQVVRLDGKPIDWSTAIVRALGCFVSLVVVGLGFFWIAIDDGKQGWHDKIAGTAVVRIPKGGVPPV